MSVESSGDPTLEGAEVTHARKIERRLELLVPGLLALFALSAVQARPHPSLAGRGLVVLLSATAFVVAAGVALRWARRSRTLDVALGAVLVATAAVLISIQPTGPGAVALFTLVVFRVRVLPGPIAVGVSVLAFAALEGFAALTAGNAESPALLAAVGGFYGMSFLAVRLDAAHAQSQQLLAELERSRDAEARAAAMAERQRLAREMHDVLAHSLSGLMLQLDAARMLSSENPADPRLSETMQRAHHMGRSGLDEARRAIAMLRGDELPGPERLPALASQFEHDHQIPCRLSITGDEHELPAEARLAVYRVAQEALTNVTTHSHAERVDIRLDYAPVCTRLIVEDCHSANGRSVPRGLASVPGGYGLSGMRERAELIGGTLIAAPTSTGFRVELEVPR